MDNDNRRPIFIGAGANLPHPSYASPRETLQAALLELDRRQARVLRCSRWYRTAPVPASDQPWYVNVVAEIATALGPDELLETLHAIEDLFGRVRSVPNAARLIDLDLLDYRGKIATPGPSRATLPHPRLTARAFVLRPLADLAPDWRHPVSAAPIGDLLAALPADQIAEPFGPAGLPFGPGRV